MTVFNNTLWQICETFITKEQWNNHLNSNRLLHREVNGYWPAFFPQRKLTGVGGSILEMAFSKKFFATRDIKEMEEFWLTYFMMTTNMKDYSLEDKEA